MAAVANLGLIGCGANEPSRAELVDALTRSGLEKPMAECMAKAFLTQLPKADIERITERGDKGVIDDPQDPNEPIDKARAEIAKCPNAASTSTSAPGETDTNQDEPDLGEKSNRGKSTRSTAAPDTTK